ncbi:MAG: response regulator [Rhizobiaceae bacterium]
MDTCPRNILVIDDDEKIRRLLRRCLEADGYTVLEASDANESHKALRDNEIDLITLDLNLGADDGLAIASNIRAHSDVPIVMVTGKGDVIDKVVGLEVGADDYISKPFHVREVQARIRSVLRRSAAAANSLPDSRAGSGGALIFEGWSACPDTFELRSPKGDMVNLTTTDFRLLQMFLEAPKRVLSRDHIMTALNGHDWQPYDRTIDNQVARLRKKIEPDPSHPEMIKTVRGVGYLFAKDVVHA